VPFCNWNYAKILGMKLVNFDSDICITLSDRTDGNMKNPGLDNWVDDEIIDNRRKFFATSGLMVERVALIRTSYPSDDYTQYKIINEPGDYQISLPNDRIERSDGMATTAHGIGLFLPIADCLAVVIWDSVKKCLMVVHAGRHNLEQNGLIKAVEFLKLHGSQPWDMKAWFSPSAGAKNYPVHAFGGKSLVTVAKEQLEKAGVTQIKIDETDTTTSDQYYSHCQGDRDKRFAILAYIKA